MEKLPLQIFFVWHPADDCIIRPLAEYCFSLLSRSVEEPFAKSVNIPVFFLTSPNQNIPSTPLFYTKKTIIFTFLSKKMVAKEEWLNYLKNNFVNKQNITLIPIALDSDVFTVNQSLEMINFIRAFEFGNPINPNRLFISIAHEIYRKGLMLDENSKSPVLKLFLSHCKADNIGETIAKKIKDFIDKNTVMETFFDATSIRPGESFEKEIDDAIHNVAFLAIHSDNYSSSYWCQREILEAKKCQIPILLLDSIQEKEDRRFPFLGNMPVLRVSYINNDDDIIFILSRILLETVRYYYMNAIFDTISKWYNIDEKAKFSGRVPEIFELTASSNNSSDVIYYADPLIYSHEKDTINKASIKAVAIQDIMECPKKKKIGISVSSPLSFDLVNNQITETHLKLMAQDIARYFLYKENFLIYGGDLRPEGYTQFLFEEARILQNRLQTKNIYLYNYLSWPIWLKNVDLFDDWKVKYLNVAKIHKIMPDEKVKDFIIDDNVYMPPNTEENKYVWAYCLSKMRDKMISDCDARICVGGKCEGYLGSMPGVLEEVLIAINKHKPIYLIGGFGGITKRICDLIMTKEFPDELSHKWQETHNAGYCDLKRFYEQNKIKFINYEKLDKILNWDCLNNGLNEEDNKRLFSTKYVDEIIYLVSKGLSEVFKEV